MQLGSRQIEGLEYERSLIVDSWGERNGHQLKQIKSRGEKFCRESLGIEIQELSVSDRNCLYTMFRRGNSHNLRSRVVDLRSTDKLDESEKYSNVRCRVDERPLSATSLKQITESNGERWAKQINRNGKIATATWECYNLIFRSVFVCWYWWTLNFDIFISYVWRHEKSERKLLKLVSRSWQATLNLPNSSTQFQWCVFLSYGRTLIV